jgi:hypothetical protein
VNDVFLNNNMPKFSKISHFFFVVAEKAKKNWENSG